MAQPAPKGPVEPVVLSFQLLHRPPPEGAAAAGALALRWLQKEVQLVHRQDGSVVSSKALGRQGGVATALAGLTTFGAIGECQVLGTSLQDDSGEGGDEDELLQLDVLLGVVLLDLFFNTDPESEVTVHVAALIDHWEQLAAHLAGDGSNGSLAFRQQLQAGWWQQQAAAPSPAGAAHPAPPAPAAAAAAAGQGKEEEEEDGGAAHTTNLRDRVFQMVLPSDWQLEAAEPPGLTCSLFKYQRRCLAWLKWRESLACAARAQEPTLPAAAAGAAAAGKAAAGKAAAAGVQAVLPDAHSCKAVLPSTSLLWRPVVLPTGLPAHYNPVEGCLSKDPVQPALPEVPGGLVCDEMGLGKTVEMLALILANPAPASSHQQRQLPAAAAAAHSDAQSAGRSDSQSVAPMAADAAAGHPRPSADASHSTSSSTSNGSKQAPRGGTLVVCPPALLQQWEAEIANHAAGSLAVEVYDGLRGLQDEAGKGKGKRLKPAQREMELYNRLLSGERIEASYDAELEVGAALRRLQAADVVLTSFDVLRAEVYFVPSSRSFRHPKKYQVPHCPLLQMRWHRLIIDEAQMVGPLSAAGTMCERIVATHRWCVTGTPMGAHRNELADIHALLAILQHQPFADATAWRRLIADPLAAGVGPVADAAWRQLGAVLLPLMWRNTKDVVAQEFHLPARALKLTWLNFTAGEKAFYEQVVEKTRKAREELASFRRQLQHGGGGGAGEGAGEELPSSPAAERSRKRRQVKQGEKLELAAADNITQLRLASIHPQLTKSWREMAAEGQLGVGATLSMEEIMQRLVDQAQFDLQEAERNLCAVLNTLAMRLMGQAAALMPGVGSGGGARGPPSAAPGGSSSQAEGAGAGADTEGPGNGSGKRLAAAAGGGEEGEEEEELELAASPRPAKRPRKSKGGGEAPSKEALEAKALSCLEMSFRVAEKGIAAIDVSMEALKGMPDIEAASTSTVNAWKRLQINTASQLSKLHAAAGREEEAQKMDRDAQEKVAYLRAQAEMEVTSAQQRLEQAQQAAAAARQAYRLHWEAAQERGFDGRLWGQAGSAADWLARLEERYGEAQEEEEMELAADESHVKHMLGTRVAAALDEVEKQLHGELTQLDRYVSEQHTAAAHRRLLREQHHWDATAAGSGRGEAGEPGEAFLKQGVKQLWDLLHFLPDFKRKTLLAQHVAFFSDLLVEEADRKQREAAQRKQEQAAAKAAAAAAGGRGAVEEGQDVEMLVPEQEQQGQGQPAQEQQQQGQHEQQPSQQHAAAAATAAAAGSHQPPRPQQQQQDEGARHSQSALQAAAATGQAFVASSGWEGAVPGYCFKLGDRGLGYYRDAPPAIEAFLTLGRLHAVAAVVGRALQDHQRRLARNAGPEAAIFASFGLDAVEARLESCKQQVQLVRVLKEQHNAERTAAFKMALQEDLDADLQKAAQQPPLPGESVEKLQKEVDSLREQAKGLLHRRRFMESKVTEARRLGRQGQQAGQESGQEERHQEQEQAGKEEGQAQQSQDDLGSAEPAAAVAGQADAGGASSASASAEAAAAEAAAAAAAGEAAEPPPATAGPSGGPAEARGMECPVCFKMVPAGSDIHVFSGCGHAFCAGCAAQLVLHQGFCALCRTKVTKKQVFRVAAGGASSQGSSDPEFNSLGQIRPQGEWSIKIECLLRRLLHLQREAPEQKSLVFSQFPDALKLVAMALKANSIRFVQLLGGRQAARKAVSDFLQDEEVRVFLLSHRAGAAGLTLVRANHVFLLEPALEPAIEQQAVARVHRIGQQRNVTVTRLLVTDSIEHRVLQVQESKHVLFAGVDGSTAEDTAEVATTVEAPVGHETLGREDMQALLGAV